MEPALQYVNDNYRKFSGCVCFTDGYIEGNPLKTKVKMLWIITSNGSMPANLPWYKMKIPA